MTAVIRKRENVSDSVIDRYIITVTLRYYSCIPRVCVCVLCLLFACRRLMTCLGMCNERLALALFDALMALVYRRISFFPRLRASTVIPHERCLVSRPASDDARVCASVYSSADNQFSSRWCVCECESRRYFSLLLSETFDYHNCQVLVSSSR